MMQAAITRVELKTVPSQALQLRSKLLRTSDQLENCSTPLARVSKPLSGKRADSCVPSAAVHSSRSSVADTENMT